MGHLLHQELALVGILLIVEEMAQQFEGTAGLEEATVASPLEALGFGLDLLHAQAGQAVGGVAVAEGVGAGVFVDFGLHHVALLVAGVGVVAFGARVLEVEAGQAEFAGGEGAVRRPLLDGAMLESF